MLICHFQLALCTRYLNKTSYSDATHTFYILHGADRSRHGTYLLLLVVVMFLSLWQRMLQMQGKWQSQWESKLLLLGYSAPNTKPVGDDFIVFDVPLNHRKEQNCSGKWNKRSSQWKARTSLLGSCAPNWNVGDDISIFLYHNMSGLPTCPRIVLQYSGLKASAMFKTLHCVSSRQQLATWITLHWRCCI